MEKHVVLPELSFVASLDKETSKESPSNEGLGEKRPAEKALSNPSLMCESALSDPILTHLTQLAAQLFQASSAQISLVEEPLHPKDLSSLSRFEHSSDFSASGHQNGSTGSSADNSSVISSSVISSSGAGALNSRGATGGSLASAVAGNVTVSDVAVNNVAIDNVTSILEDTADKEMFQQAISEDSFVKSPALGSSFLKNFSLKELEIFDSPKEASDQVVPDQVVPDQVVVTSLAPSFVAKKIKAKDSLCTFVLQKNDFHAIEDSSLDESLKNFPSVKDGSLRSYLGVPIKNSLGELLGVFCLYDTLPRKWYLKDVALLERLASAAGSEIELSTFSSDYLLFQVRRDLAFKSAGIGSFTWDLKTEQLLADQTALELLDVSLEEVLLDPNALFKNMPEEDFSLFEKDLREAVSLEKSFHKEITIKDRCLAFKAKAFSTEKSLYLLGTVHDITPFEKLKNEAADVLETMSTGFLSTDKNWTIRYLNAYGEKIINRSFEDVKGKHFWELFPNLKDTVFEENYQRAFSQKEKVEFEAFYPHLSAWFEVRVAPYDEGLAFYFLDITENKLAKDRLELMGKKDRLIAEIGPLLTTNILHPKIAAQRLIEVVIPELAPWGAAVLLGEEVKDYSLKKQALSAVSFSHQEESLLEVTSSFASEFLNEKSFEEDSSAPASLVLKSVEANQYLVFPQEEFFLSDKRYESIFSQFTAIIPFSARKRVFGALILCKDGFSLEELEVIQEVADRIALALDNAHLYQEQRSLATTLQHSLLTKPPVVKNCEIEVRYIPAASGAAVGGDWFDSFLHKDGSLCFAIGDVTGHDKDAAAFMGQLRGLLRGIAWHSNASPKSVLEGVDAAMEGLELFTTASSILLHLETDEVRRPEMQQLETKQPKTKDKHLLSWSNAGHLPPFLLKDQKAVLLSSSPDLILGVAPDISRTESFLSIAKGSTVFLYTDGLVERRGKDIDKGIDLLRESLEKHAALPLGDLCSSVLADLLPPDAEDDVALIAVRV